MIWLAVVLCLTVDGTPVEPLELMDPPIRATTPQGQEIVALNYADALRLAVLMRDKGFVLDQIVGALMPHRVVPEGSDECGCQIGHLWKPTWYGGKKSCLLQSYDGPLCLRCTACPKPDDTPLAMWKP